MNRIIAAEYRKIFSKRLIWLVLAVVLLANGALFVFQQYQTRDYQIDMQKDLQIAERQYQSMPFSEAYQEIQGIYEDYTTIMNYQMFTLDENFSVPEDMEQDYQEALERRQGDPAFEDKRLMERRQAVVTELYQQADYMRSYPNYISGMEERAEQMQSVSIFQKPNTFSYRNTVKTPKDFEYLKEIPLSFGNSVGLAAVQEFPATDLFLLAFSFLMCIYLFLQEKENSLLPMVKATPGGGLKTIVAKMVVLFTLTVGTAGIVYGSNLLLSGWIFGFGDLGRYIQSMNIFRSCNLLLTVGQWLILFWSSKVGAVLFSTLVFALVFTLFENNKGIYLTLLLFLAASWGCWEWIMPLSSLNYLKYVNVFSFFDVFSLYGEYTNINLFGYPVNIVPVCLFSAGAIVLLLIVAILLFFIRRKGNGLIFPTLWKRKKLAKIRGTSNLWLAEIRKILVTQRVWILLLLAVLVAWQQIDISPLKMNFDDAVYKQYATTFAGELTEEKDRLVAEEEQKFANLGTQIQKLEEKQKSGEISLEEKEKEKNKLTKFGEKEKGFQRFLSQYKKLQQKRAEGYSVAVIDELSSDQLFDQLQRDTMHAVLYSIFLILSLCNIFPMDQKKLLDSLIHATARGGSLLLKVRIAFSCILSIFLAVVLYLPVWINFKAKYVIADWSASIQSIKDYQNVSFPISLRDMVMFSSVVFFMGILAIVLGILLLSQLCRKQAVSVIICTLVFICPLFLPLLGVTFANLFCMNNVFYSYATIADYGMVPQFVYLAGLFILLLFLLWGNQAFFVTRKIGNK